MKSEVARLFVYQLNVSLFHHFELHFPPLNWSSVFAICLNLLIYYGHWYLSNRIHVFLKFNKTDKVELHGERSASQAHANISYRVKLFTFCSQCKLLFTSWLFVGVFRADKHFEDVQNWPQTTLRRRKTWWNQKSAWLFVYHSNYNYLT